MFVLISFNFHPFAQHIKYSLCVQLNAQIKHYRGSFTSTLTSILYRRLWRLSGRRAQREITIQPL